MHPFLQAAMLAAAVNPTGVVTLTEQTGANKAEDLIGGTALWRFRFDGTVRNLSDPPGEVQVNASTDWVIPNSRSQDGYQLKWDPFSGDNPTGGATLPAGGVWTPIPVTGSIDIGAFANFGQLEEGIATVSIRLGTGPTLSSAEFEWRAIDTISGP